MSTFYFGIANRGASIYIRRYAKSRYCACFEDRRPSYSYNIYIITVNIMEIIGLKSPIIFFKTKIKHKTFNIEYVH